MVKRYMCNDSDGECRGMLYEHPNGVCVGYLDYQKLEAERDALKASHRKLLEALREKAVTQQGKMMSEVYIDGVKYIPAKTVLANEIDIAKGLLMQFWGVCSDEQAREFVNDQSIKVLVNDYDEGVPLRDVLDTIATLGEDE